MKVENSTPPAEKNISLCSLLVGLESAIMWAKHVTSDVKFTLERSLGHKHPQTQGSVALRQERARRTSEERVS